VAGPFYPVEATEKGVTHIYIGLIMGTFAIADLVTCILVGRALSKIGRHFSIKIGLALLICSMILLGSLRFVQNRSTFIFISFIA